MSDKERVVLIHYYQGAVVATALRYPDEMRDLFHIPELENLPEPDKEGLSLMTRIADKQTADRDPDVSHHHLNEIISLGGPLLPVLNRVL